MVQFHSSTFRLIGVEPNVTQAAVSEVEQTERRLGFRLPSSVRQWYSNEDAIGLLARYSNQDWPVPLREFVVKESNTHQLLTFKKENQGVCDWAIDVNGSDDPPVYVDVDSNGAQWTLHTPTFTAYVHACVWDYVQVFDQPGLVQSQNEPLSSGALTILRDSFAEEPQTFGWPGTVQYRFAGKGQAILIWASETQADWFVGARDVTSLQSALSAVWNLDGVGQSFYDCSATGKVVLENIRRTT